LRYFGTSFLCKCNQPILKKIATPGEKVEYTSVVQNRTESASDSEILIESFSDEEDVKDVKKETNGSDAIEDSHHDGAEIRKLLRRKDELERKQKMDEKYKERLQVSDRIKCCFEGFMVELWSVKKGREGNRSS
jgi:hypothetical protein